MAARSAPGVLCAADVEGLLDAASHTDKPVTNSVVVDLDATSEENGEDEESLPIETDEEKDEGEESMPIETDEEKDEGEESMPNETDEEKDEGEESTPNETDAEKEDGDGRMPNETDEEKDEGEESAPNTRDDETDEKEELPARGTDEEEELPAKQTDEEEELPAKQTDEEEEPPARGADEEEELPARGTDEEEELPAKESDQEFSLPCESAVELKPQFEPMHCFAGPFAHLEPFEPSSPLFEEHLGQSQAEGADGKDIGNLRGAAASSAKLGKNVNASACDELGSGDPLPLFVPQPSSEPAGRLRAVPAWAGNVETMQRKSQKYGSVAAINTVQRRRATYETGRLEELAILELEGLRVDEEKECGSLEVDKRAKIEVVNAAFQRAAEMLASLQALQEQKRVLTESQGGAQKKARTLEDARRAEEDGRRTEENLRRHQEDVCRRREDARRRRDDACLQKERKDLEKQKARLTQSYKKLVTDKATKVDGVIRLYGAKQSAAKARWAMKYAQMVGTQGKRQIAHADQCESANDMLLRVLADTQEQ